LTPVPDVGATVFAMDINQDGSEDLLAANLENFYYYEFKASVSTHSIPAATGVSIFPTLIQDKCQIINNNNGIVIDKVMLSDITGGKVTVLGAIQEIDFRSFASGVYLVTVYLQDGRQVSQRVLKVMP